MMRLVEALARATLPILVLFLLTVLGGCTEAPTEVKPTSTPAFPAEPSLAQPAKPTVTMVEVSRSREAGAHEPIPELLMVTNSGDAGPGTLREALAALQPGQTVRFDEAVFPPGNPTTIRLQSALPAITATGARLDGFEAGVLLDGSQAGRDRTAGLDVRGDSVTISGLHIVDFAGCGIELHSRDNIIGPDNRLAGNGQAGICLFDEPEGNNLIHGNWIGLAADSVSTHGIQGDGIHINGAGGNTIAGNVISGNRYAGLQLCCNTASSHNRISRNLIGLAADGESPAPNGLAGIWLHDGASDNSIGPGNTIAYNEVGILIESAASQRNTIRENTLRAAPDAGIILRGGANGGIQAPIIGTFLLAEGLVSGRACAGCQVELYSDARNQGEHLEATLQADENGHFVRQAGSALRGPCLSATATDAAGNSSAFSGIACGSGVESVLQTGNLQAPLLLPGAPSSALADNRIGTVVASPREQANMEEYLIREVFSQGFKHVHVASNEVEEPIDWHADELPIGAAEDAWIDLFVENGVQVTYVLSFWDKEHHRGGWPAIESRFTTEEEVERYLEYVRQVVRHFRGRIYAYDLWNEPDNMGSRIQYIAVEDYIELVKRVVPVVREEDPEALIQVGNVSWLGNPFAQAYLYAIVGSEIMPLVDVVAWHPLYGTAPDVPEAREYYAGYADLVREIQATARSAGFTGSFSSDEMYWCYPGVSHCGEGMPIHSYNAAAKYTARAVVTHLGLDVKAGLCASTEHASRAALLRNLTYVFAGAEAGRSNVELVTTAERPVSYTFALATGDTMVVMWDDAIASDEDAGDDTTLRLPGMASRQATIVDPLHGYGQPLITRSEADHLIIEGLRLKDYPLLVILSETD